MNFSFRLLVSVARYKSVGQTIAHIQLVTVCMKNQGEEKKKKFHSVVCTAHTHSLIAQRRGKAYDDVETLYIPKSITTLHTLALACTDTNIAASKANVKRVRENECAQINVERVVMVEGDVGTLRLVLRFFAHQTHIQILMTTTARRTLSTSGSVAQHTSSSSLASLIHRRMCACVVYIRFLLTIHLYIDDMCALCRCRCRCCCCCCW